MKKLLTILLSISCYIAHAQSSIITTFANLGFLASPTGITIDGTGNIYFTNGDQLFKANSLGVVTAIAGNDTGGFYGDGGPATAAELYVPVGIAADASGNIYIADRDNQRVREINSSGIITTIAGTGTIGYAGDGAPATMATLDYPQGVEVDGAGNVYIACNSTVRKINTSGIISTIAGTGIVGYSGDGGPATAAQVNETTSIALDGSGDIFIADRFNSCIREINSSGIITTFAGTGTAGYSGDGAAASAAQLAMATGVYLDGSGNMIIADDENNRIRKVNSSGIITTIAGTDAGGYAGDGGAATAAELYNPWNVAGDAAGNIYLTDNENGRIRKINCNTAPITGSTSVCAGSMITLTDSYTGGTWSTSSSGIATVSGGVVTAIGQGVDTVFYTTTGVCGTATAINIDTVYPSSAKTIDGIDSVCVGYTVTLSDSVTGGTWSSTSSSLATISSAGVVTGVSAGLDIIQYTVSNVCGTYNALLPVTIMPSSGTISGSDSVCIGYSVAFADPVSGGGWSCSNGVANVNSSGLVTGVSSGVGIIEYTVTNICGTHTALFPITVIPATSSCSGLGIVNNAAPTFEFNLFPNPADNLITVSSTKRITSITISNLIGQELISRECNTDKVQVNIENLQTGVYFIKINGVNVKRFLKG